MDMFIVTAAWIDRHQTAKGGWTALQLAQLGVAWPPARGWKHEAQGRRIADDQRRTFESFGEAPTPPLSLGEHSGPAEAYGWLQCPGQPAEIPPPAGTVPCWRGKVHPPHRYYGAAQHR